MYDITVKSLNDLGVLTSTQTEEIMPTELYKYFRHGKEDQEIYYASVLDIVENLT